MRLGILLLFPVLLFIGCGDDEARLKIQRDIAKNQEQIYEIERRQAQLRNEIRQTLDEVNNKLDDKTSQANLTDQIYTLRETLSALQARITDLENSVVELSRSKSTIPTAPVQPVGDQPLAPIESVSGEVVEGQFNQALLDFNRGKYDVAIMGFEAVLESFPNSPYTESSYYYLGRAFVDSKQYQKAVAMFQRITRDFPSGDFIKQSLYYEGQCYYFLNQHSKAILTLRDLTERFAGTQEADLARQFLKKAGYEK